MTTPTRAAGTWETRMFRNMLQLAAWTAAWVATLALVKFGPGALWTEQTASTVALIALNFLLGLGVIFSNKRHLQALDELQRAVQLNAMGWALGSGLIGGTTWKVIEGHDLVAFTADIPHLIMLMALVYLAAVVIGMRRYR